MPCYGKNYLTEGFVKYISSEYRNVIGEQETKNKLIEPLFKKIGYDIDCIEDTRTEVTCGVGIKKEKVDYMLCIAGQPKILVEAKDWKVKLSEIHTNQLFRYFCSTDCKIGILTNGINYRFFSDFEKENIMDDKPFYCMNVLAPKENDEKILTAICKTQQCSYDVKKFVVELKTRRLLEKKDSLAKLIAQAYFNNENYYDAVLNGLSGQF